MITELIILHNHRSKFLVFDVLLVIISQHFAITVLKYFGTPHAYLVFELY